VDWLAAACIVLKVAGALLVVLLQCWHKIFTILQQMGSKGRYLVPEGMSQTLLTNKKHGKLD
jgi:hypothetical protein